MKRILLLLALLATSASARTGINGQVNFLGAVTTPVCAKSADYVVTDTDGCALILVTTGANARTMTLPSAANNVGRSLIFKKADSGSGNIVLNRAGSDTIDGATTTTFAIGVTNQYATLSMVSDGAIWNVTSVVGDVLRTTISSGATLGGSANTYVDAGTGISLTPGMYKIEVNFTLAWLTAAQASDDVTFAIRTGSTVIEKQGTQVWNLAASNTRYDPLSLSAIVRITANTSYVLSFQAAYVAATIAVSIPADGTAMIGTLPVGAWWTVTRLR
jgi:hypothetical protein